MKYEVIVELKKEVLDPSGRAIHQTLARLGRDDVKGIRVSKRFIIEIDGKAKDPEAAAKEVAKEFLANPVSEFFTVRKLEA